MNTCENPQKQEPTRGEKLFGNALFRCGAITAWLLFGELMVDLDKKLPPPTISAFILLIALIALVTGSVCWAVADEFSKFI